MSDKVPVRGLFIKALPPIGSSRVTNLMSVQIPWYNMEVSPSDRKVKVIEHSIFTEKQGND